MDGHRDAVKCLATIPTSLTRILSGAYDGEVRVWNLTTRKTVWASNAHVGFVSGLASNPEGTHFVSCGADKTVKMWSVENEVDAQVEAEVEEEGNAVAPIPRSTTVDVKPISTFIGQYAFNAVDHHRRKDWFATSAINIDLWSHERSDPIQSFTWGADTIQTCRFNPVEVNLLASAASDRNVVLYDVRTRTPVRKIVLGMMTNAIAWNPLEGMVFAIANEDHNCYTFDMRHLNHALSIHKDHVAAVMSLDFSPTGQEFVTGSYDKTLRVFPVNEGHSREVYHAKRMQRIYSVKFSGDAKYVLSGSDDTNIRLWKARAAESLRALLPREQAAMNYRNKLKEKFKHAPEIKRIARHRHVPQQIKSMQRKQHEIKSAAAVKDERRRKHSKPESHVFVPDKKRKILSQTE